MRKKNGNQVPVIPLLTLRRTWSIISCKTSPLFLERKIYFFFIMEKVGRLWTTYCLPTIIDLESYNLTKVSELFAFSFCHVAETIPKQ